MSFQDVVLLSSRASFHTTFLRQYDKCESLGTTTCIKTVVGVSKGMLPVKYFHLQQPLFVSMECHADHETVTEMR